MRDKDNRKDFATRIDAGIKERFQQKAKSENMTMSEVMEALMVEYIDDNYKMEQQPKYKAIKINKSEG